MSQSPTHMKTQEEKGPSYAGVATIGDGGMQITDAIALAEEGMQITDAAAAAASQGKPLKTRRQTSTAWLHFDRVVVKGLNKAKCKHCGKLYAAHSNRNGTSTLNGHVKVCDKNPDNRVGRAQQILSYKAVGKGQGGELKPWHFDQQMCRNALGKMLVIDELPFNFVEGEGFKLFTSTICPNFNVPSRHTSMRDIFSMYESEKLKLHAYFQATSPRVSLTTDTWTSNQQINYMCLTAHFIDDGWVLHKKIINFCPIDSHKGEDIGKAVESCLHSWGLDKVMTVTVDNAKANDKAIEYLTSRMNLLSTSVLGGRFMHMRCIAHILNLIVSDGIGMLGTSVERIRFAVRFIKLSPMRLSRFKLAVNQAGIDTKKLLCLDVPTRWNSTYLMLKAACRLERAFEKYEILDPSLAVEMDNRFSKEGSQPLGRLTFRDWADLKSYMSFLELFYDMTVHVSGSLYVTSNLILDDISDIYHSIKGGLSSDNKDMKAMAGKMASKFEKYFANLEMLNMYTFIAPVFDPRKKLNWVIYIIQQMYPLDSVSKLVPCVKQALDDLFAQYVKLYDTSNESMSQPDSSASDIGKPSRGLMFAAYKKQKVSQEGSGKSELDRYLKEDDEEDQPYFDILNWWSKNGHRYPVISRMARDILAIPISTVSSESAFSTGGRVLTDFRSSLSPTIVQCLICTQDWLKKKSPCANAKSLEEEMEKLQIVEDEIGESQSHIGAPLLM